MLKELIVFTSISIIYVLSNTPKNFGPFILEVTESKLCKGPKRKDCCNLTSITKGKAKVNFDVVVKEDTSPSKGKVIAMSNDKEVVKMQMKKPCDHVFMKPIIYSTMNVTKDCVILKGHYHYSIDVDNIAQNFYGGMLMYGNWTFMLLMYSENCNFACIVMQATVTEPINTNGST